MLSILLHGVLVAISSNWTQNQIILNLISLYFLAASKGSSSSSFFLWWNSELSTQATEANATEVSQPEELEDQPAWLHMYTYHAWWSIKNKPFLLHSVPSWPDNALACKMILKMIELGSVTGPVLQANGRLTFEDDLRSGSLLYFTTQWNRVHTELADSMVTLGEPEGV